MLLLSATCSSFFCLLLSMLKLLHQQKGATSAYTVTQCLAAECIVWVKAQAELHPVQVYLHQIKSAR
jgi:hypothetical protein